MSELSELRELRRKVDKDLILIDKLKREKTLNFSKTLPGTPNLAKLMVGGTQMHESSFLLYAIKDEEIDAELEQAINRYNVDVANYNDMLKYMSKYEHIILIEYFKNELGYKWEEIDRYFHWGEDTARTKIKRYLKASKKD